MADTNLHIACALPINLPVQKGRDKMNVIKETRLNKHITVERMASYIHVPICIYCYLEDYKQFDIIQYRIICKKLELDFDIHI